MKIDRINSTLALTANIGILIGLFFVILELRQNQDTLDASIQLSLSSGYQEIASRPVENRQFAAVLVKAFGNLDDLDMVDKVQLMNWNQEQLTLLYATYELRNSGIVSEAVWDHNANWFATFLETPQILEFYETYSRHVYPEDFFLEIESRIGD